MNNQYNINQLKKTIDNNTITIKKLEDANRKLYFKNKKLKKEYYKMLYNSQKFEKYFEARKNHLEHQIKQYSNIKKY